MATIEYPTARAYEDILHINNIEFPDLPLRADDATVSQYLVDVGGVSLVSYESDNVRFSNDGARLYNYYDTTTSEWKNAWGYSPIVTSIVTNP